MQQMVFLWERGHSREWVLGLTIEQLADLYDVCEKLEARNQLQTFWSRRIAQNGEKKHVKDFVKLFTDILKRRNRKDSPLQGNDAAAFLSKYGGGF